MTGDIEGYMTFCEAAAGEMRRDLERLVGLESPSGNKEAVDRCGAVLAERLRADGAAVSLLPQQERGDHLRAEWPGDGRRVLLLGHFDTVWDVGQLARMPIREADGRLFGPGIFDMKAGIVVAMAAVRALRTLSPAAIPSIVMLWTTDEEVGSGTSRAVIELEAQRSDAVLVLEPSLPGGAVKTRRKGCGEFVLTAHGISAHAGIDPGQGASAIHEIAFQIAQLEGLSDRARGTTLNVGTLEGGTRPNVVAEHASAVIDVRVSSMDDARRIEDAIRSLRPRDPRVRLEISGRVERPPLERSDGVASLFEQARSVAAQLGRSLDEGGTGGGSDGNFTAALGVPTLDGLGPMGDGAHALHEHVVLDDLPWRAAWLAGLMVRVEAAK